MSDRYLAQFLKPATAHDSYRSTGRRGRFSHVELPLEVEARITKERGQSVDLERTARITVLKGPEQTVIWKGEWQTGNAFTGVIEHLEFELTDALVLAVEVADNDDFTVWPRCEPFAIGPAPPLDVPRWVPVRAVRNTTNSDVWLGIGYVWYPGHFPEISPSYREPRNHPPISGRPSLDELYAQRVTSAMDRGHCREFNVMETGHVAQQHKMKYHTQDMFWSRGLQVGLFRDGHRNLSTIQNPCSGFEDSQGTAVILSCVGRVVEIDKHDVMRTIFGWRLKGDHLTPGPGPRWTWGVNEDYLHHFEVVGKFAGNGPQRLGHSWQLCPDPDDEQVIYIADVGNQCIWKAHRRTGEIEVLAGSLEGKAGFQDGHRYQARFYNPRGVCWKDGLLYIGDAANGAFRTIDRDGNVRTVLGPSEHIPHHGGQAAAREVARGGSFEEAIFNHPQQLDTDSRGRILTVMHHQEQIMRFDFDNRTVELLTSNLEVSENPDNYWHTISVDKTGAFLAKNDMIGTTWQNNSDFWFDENGEYPGTRTPRPQFTEWMQTMGYEGSHTSSFGYPQLAFFGNNTLWYGGNGGIMRISKRFMDDPAMKGRQFSRGRRVWRRAPSPYRPALALIHGEFGTDKFGLETIDDLGRLSKEELREWLDERDREDITEGDLDDLYHFIQSESITGRGQDEAPPAAPEAPRSLQIEPSG